MKTRELIAQLQEQDPSGELEVVAGGTPIYFVQRYAAYYDGCLRSLIIDDSKKPHYSIVGFKVTGRGEKVKLHLMDLDDVICDDPDAVLDVSELEPHRAARYQQLADGYRANTRKINAEIEAEKGKP